MREGRRLPTWGFVVASVAACCVVAMVALAVKPSPASLLMHAQTVQIPLQNKHLLSSLKEGSNAPHGEPKFLADRLGAKSAIKEAALKAFPVATPDQVSLLRPTPPQWAATGRCLTSRAVLGWAHPCVRWRLLVAPTR